MGLSLLIELMSIWLRKGELNKKVDDHLKITFSILLSSVFLIVKHWYI